jgi:hypothetical protein
MECAHAIEDFFFCVVVQLLRQDYSPSFILEFNNTVSRRLYSSEMENQTIYCQANPIQRRVHVQFPGVYTVPRWRSKPFNAKPSQSNGS